MMELTLTWPELLVAVVLATVVYLLETVLLAGRRSRRTFPGADGELGREVQELRSEIAMFQQRLAELEARGVGAGAPEPEGGHSAYDYAIQYARQGMAAQEIAGRCGISRDEAALIIALHRKSQEA